MAASAERLFLRLAEDASHGPETSAPNETLSAHPIAAPLAGVLSQILLYRESLPAGVEVQERVVPDGAVRLVFHLGDVAPSALVLGASVAPALLTLRGRLDGLSIALRAGAAARVLGIPANELRGIGVPIGELWGKAGAELLERVATARTDAQRVAILQRGLQRRVQTSLHPSQPMAVHAAQRIVRSGGRCELADVAAELGVGERRLQQIFQAQIGLSPRSWRRLARLHDCLRSLRRGAPSWAELALDHGFYDQSHLVNEFRALCGVTPTELMRRTIADSSKTRSQLDAT